MTKLQIAEQIIDELYECDYISFAHALYEEQKEEAIRIVADRLQDYILIQGVVIE